MIRHDIAPDVDNNVEDLRRNLWRSACLAVARRLFREDRAVAPLHEIMSSASAHLDNALGLLAMVDRQIAHHKKHGGKEQCFEHK
ncbi:MAG: hypothetical protein ABIS51_00925 [Sphingomonas sp.]